MNLKPGMPYALIIGAGLLWGATFSLTLIATSDGTPPIVLAAIQVVLCSGLFVFICKLSSVPIFRVSALRHYFILAVLGISAPNLMYYYAAPHLSAGILSVTVSTVPMVTYALAWGMKMERFVVKRASGILLGMIAIILLLVPDHGLQSSDASFWTLVVLLCVLCYSIENIYISEGVEDSIDVRELLCGSNFIASLILIPVMLFQGHTVSLEWMQSTSGLALIGISLTSTFAYRMFFYTIKTSGPVFASQCAYIVTLAGVVWGIVLLSESHSIWVWISIVVMMVGLALVSPERRNSRC